MFSSAIAQGCTLPLVTRASATLNSVLLWCLPTYAAVVIALALASVHPSIPFRLQLALSNAWMVVALFLPIGTLVAAVKAVAVPFRATDNQRHIGRYVLGWCLVVVALAMNVFCYMVIARALR